MCLRERPSPSATSNSSGLEIKRKYLPTLEGSPGSHRKEPPGGVMQVNHSIGPAYGTPGDRRLVTPILGSTHGPQGRTGRITSRFRRPPSPTPTRRAEHYGGQAPNDVDLNSPADIDRIVPCGLDPRGSERSRIMVEDHASASGTRASPLHGGDSPGDSIGRVASTRSATSASTSLAPRPPTLRQHRKRVRVPLREGLDSFAGWVTGSILSVGAQNRPVIGAR